MSNNETEFGIRYSCRMEQFNTIFYNRIEALMTFTQIVLGSTIFAGANYSVIAGAIVAIISAISFSVKPSVKAAASDSQYKRYTALISSRADTNEQQEMFNQIQENDTHVLLSFAKTAYIRAGIEMNLDVASRELSTFELFMARFVGENLSRTNNH